MREARERVFVARANKGLHWPQWRELWEGRQLLYLLARRDVRLRYSQTFLGVLWVVIQPLATMLVLRQLVARAAGPAGANSMSPALFIFAGLVPWLYFATSVSGGSASLAANSTLLTKVYFPRILVPLAPTLAALVDLLVGVLAMVAVALAVGADVSPKLLWLFPVLTIAVLVTQAATVSLGALGVRYRDVRHAVPFFLQFTMLASPVLYPESVLPPVLREIHRFNPLAISLNGVRSVFIPGPMEVDRILVGLLFGAVLWLGGIVLFYQYDRSLADRV